MSPAMTTTTEHAILASPLGNLTAVRDAQGLVGLYFPHHWYRPDPATFGPRVDSGFDDVARQLEEYFTGERREFDLPLTPRGDELQRRVWDLVAEVPYGQTTTYGALTRGVGENVTAQQIGAAVGRNPLCILIPCHRVIGSGGRLTGYAGGLKRKAALLELEQPTLPTLGIWRT
jgi:methylated-DNA-[protein]-cysteine S-methyltransferase